MKFNSNVKDIGLVILGNFILAVGVALFIIPNSILSGGVAGISVAISPLVDIPTTWIINILTIVLFIFGVLMLGKNFAIKTLFSAILYPSFVSLLSLFSKHFFVTDDPILASVYGGVLIGIGIGLVFRTGASTGGMDIPPLIINKYTHIPLPRLIMIFDGFTVLLGISIYGIEPALIGLLSVGTSSMMVNKAMMFGLAQEKSLMIISDKYQEILDQIAIQVDRGATIIDAKGGYRNDKRPILMVVILNKQFPVVNRIVQQVDPSAFVIIHDVNEVQGEGFTFSE